MSKKTESKKTVDNGKLEKANTPKCSTFGAIKFNNPACVKCASSFKTRFEACKEVSKAKAIKKTVKVKASAYDCFNARIESDTHKFIMEVYKNPCTMKAIKACSWNTRPNTFYCKAKSLIKNGYMLKNAKSGTFSLSAKGKKKLEKWIEERKKEKAIENKKVA